MRPINLVLIAIILCFASPVFAQEPAGPVPMQAAEDLTQAEQVDPQDAEVGINPGRIPSVLFTYWEHTAIKDARRSRGSVRAPTEAELMRDLGLKSEDRIKPPPEARDISLGGIVYVSKGEWTIWLNGKRVTPQALPSEAIDLAVYKNHIELKWFDEWTNRIYPIRLKPHQRFNIDTRIFLPG